MGAPPASTRLAVFLRVVAAVIAGYAFTIGVAALVAVTLPQMHVATRDEAVIVAALAGCALYPVVVMWGFATPSVGRLWFVLAGGAGVTLVMATAMARAGH